MTIWDAAQTGDLDNLRASLEKDANLLSSPSPDGWTPLHLAAHFGHSSLAAYLLAIGADPLAGSSSVLANLPIHAAAAGRHAGILALLLAAARRWMPRGAAATRRFTQPPTPVIWPRSKCFSTQARTPQSTPIPARLRLISPRRRRRILSLNG